MKRIIPSLIIASIMFLLAAVGFIGLTQGWFIHEVVITTHIINVGDLRYQISGDFVDDIEVIYPGFELVDTNFSLTNTSPIASQVRVKITYTRIVVVDEIVQVNDHYVYRDLIDDHLAVTFLSIMTLGDGDEIPDEYDDDYWYFGSYDTIIPQNSGDMPLISSITYDGALTGNEYFDQTIRVSIQIEVKQGDHVTWSALVDYDFYTGYPE
ncbi:MAG: hypothetical protein WC351_04970 [Candidatus Izemoplasmatales bacterium]